MSRHTNHEVFDALIDVTPNLAGASIAAIDVLIGFGVHDERFVGGVECPAHVQEEATVVSTAANVVVAAAVEHVGAPIEMRAAFVRSSVRAIDGR